MKPVATSQPYAGELYVWNDKEASPKVLARRERLVAGR